MAVRPFPEQHRRQHRIGIWLALSALFVVVELLLVRPEVAGSPRPALLADVMALDLALGLPLLGYALVIRGGYVSAAVLPLLLLASTGLAFLAVPEGGGRVLPVLIVVAPALELAAIAVGLWRLRAIIEAYRAARSELPYASDALRVALGTGGKLPPALARMASFELTAIACAVAGWRWRFVPRPGVRAYSSHRTSGQAVLAGALVFLMLIEIPLVHLTVHAVWSDLAAWLLTALSAYGLLWVIGDVQASRLHPHTVTATHLHLRAGQRAASDLALASITAVRGATAQDGADASIVAFGTANIRIEVAPPAVVHGFLGRPTEASNLLIRTDEPERFIRDLEARLAADSGASL